MTTELAVLAWGCILAFIHIFAAIRVKTRQYGTAWNMGARDEDLPPPKPIVGRLERARDNYLETFPIAVAAILMLAMSGESSRWTEAGAFLWLGARIVYLPLYAAGTPRIRTFVYLLSVVGIGLMLAPSLWP